MLAVYHGARGRYHYFLCQQLILRMQVEAITKLWSLPPEFEVRYILGLDFNRADVGLDYMPRYLGSSRIPAGEHASCRTVSLHSGGQKG